MDYFKYKNGKLYCEEVDLERMAEIATPFYLYSWNTFREHYLRFRESFKELNPLICFAVKTCGNVTILKGLAGLGAGMDIVSGGELFLSLSAGVSPERIVYAGVGKTVAEIEFAADRGIGFFNIESEPEFVRIEKIVAGRNKTMKALLRVNPDEYDRNTHAKTTTGKKGGKFGVDIDRVPGFFDAHGRSEHLQLAGLHIHIGSPVYAPQPYVKAIGKVVKLIEQLQSKGFSITYLNIGGGYPAAYEAGTAPPWDAYAEAMVPLLKPLVNQGMKIIMEPGRTIAANAGILVTSVQYVKKTGDNRNILITDTGMHHLLRPALYDAQHFIWPVTSRNTSREVIRKFDLVGDDLTEYDIVGPICESSDYLAKGRMLPWIEPGERLAVFTTGAYGFVMASRYNAQPLPAEYLIAGDRIIPIRESETYEDLMHKQCGNIPEL